MELSPRQKQVYDLRNKGLAFHAIGTSLGITTSTARAFHARARQRMAANSKLERPRFLDIDLPIPTNPQEMAEVCEETAAHILVSMNRESIQGATLAQKARAFNDLIHNSRLLKGEATQIISHEDRRQLKDLIPAMLLEAKRRGITLDVTPDAVTTD